MNIMCINLHPRIFNRDLGKAQHSVARKTSPATTTVASYLNCICDAIRTLVAAAHKPSLHIKSDLLLIKMIETREMSDEAVYVQHRLADLMARQQESGFLFDMARGQQLADELIVRIDAIRADTDNHGIGFGYSIDSVAEPARFLGSAGCEVLRIEVDDVRRAAEPRARELASVV